MRRGGHRPLPGDVSDDRFDLLSKAYAFNASRATANDFQQGLSGDASTQDATFEFVFRPGDYVGDHVIFETGGTGDGLGLVLLGDLLEFRAQDANNDTQRIIVNYTLPAGEETEFFHVVATIQTGPKSSRKIPSQVSRRRRLSIGASVPSPLR